MLSTRIGAGVAASAVAMAAGTATMQAALSAPSGDAPYHPAVAEEVEVTILSSNLASAVTVGEWGLSALVRADGRCVLFDAGRNPDTVLFNARALDVDLSCVTDVVLSHFHFDHTTGLLPLIRDLRAQNPDAIRRVHVGDGFFLPRRWPDVSGDDEMNQMIALRDTLAAAGVEIIEHDGPAEIVPSVWVTGPIERRHSEKNYPTAVRVQMDDDWVEDYVPDSQGVTIVTEEGHVVLLGCGHAGAVNALDHIRDTIADLPIHALMGGLHLFAASDEVLGWTADRLRAIGVEHLMAGHCTGIEPLIRLRTGLNLDRETAVVGAVGSRFVYGEGIHPTAIAW
ncbi:MAG: MBL fold metallo-hydrolase [Gemmatimonadota bacterium]|nr:MBL fold metallo-hydrolase [Gemmatimonadota bacterium]